MPGTPALASVKVPLTCPSAPMVSGMLLAGHSSVTAAGIGCGVVSRTKVEEEDKRAEDDKREEDKRAEEDNGAEEDKDAAVVSVVESNLEAGVTESEPQEDRSRAPERTRLADPLHRLDESTRELFDKA